MAAIRQNRVDVSVRHLITLAVASVAALTAAIPVGARDPDVVAVVLAAVLLLGAATARRAGNR